MRLEREVVESCEKKSVLSKLCSIAMLLSHINSRIISWNFLSGPKCLIHQLNLILSCDLYALPLSLLKTHMHAKKCFSRVPLPCQKRICRIKVSQQVTWSWLTQTQVRGLWASLVMVFFKLSYLPTSPPSFVARTFLVRWGIYPVGYDFFSSSFCLEARETIDSS